MIINDEQYYGFLLDGSIGTYTLPVYDNIELEGDPIARLRGNMITNPTGSDFTATAAMYFYELKSYVGVHVSYTYEPSLEDDFVYGFTIGGTRAFERYRASVTSIVVAESPKFIVEWTFCT